MDIKKQNTLVYGFSFLLLIIFIMLYFFNNILSLFFLILFMMSIYVILKNNLKTLTNITIFVLLFLTINNRVFSLSYLMVFLIFSIFLSYLGIIYSSILYTKFNLSSRVKLWLSLFFLWLVYMMIQLIWIDIYDYTLANYKFTISGFLLVFISVWLMNTKEKIKFFIYSWNIILMFLLVFGWAEILFNYHLPGTLANKINMTGVATGTYYNPNDFSYFLVISLPLLLYLLSSRSFFVKSYVYLALITILYFNIQADARLSMIITSILIIFSFLYLTIKNIKRKKIFTAIFLSFLLILPIFFILKDFAENIATVGLEDNSINIRWKLLSEAVRVFTDNPFGVGAGNSQIAILSNLYSNTQGISNIHNFYFETLANFGFLIFSILIVITFSILIALIKRIIIERGKGDFLTFIFLLLNIIFIIISTVPSSAFRYEITWLVYGVTFAYINTKSDSTYKKQK